MWEGLEAERSQEPQQLLSFPRQLPLEALHGENSTDIRLYPVWYNSDVILTCGLGARYDL